MLQKYLVTGASGYIAMHVVDQLLKQGHHVRGTIRSLKDQEKVESLKRLGPIELVEANLMDDESLRRAVRGVDVVMHVASPISNTFSMSEEEIVKEAVHGTLSVLKAALDENVKKVVVTSSSLTVFPMSGWEKRTYSEKDWVDAATLSGPHTGYQKSKILAERAAWDFYREHKKNGKCFDLAVVLPSFTVGPILSKGTASSPSFFLKLFDKSGKTVEDFPFPISDVRDVALAHLRAAELDEAAGHRFVVVSEPNLFSMYETAQLLKEAGYKVNEVVGRKPYEKASFDETNLRKILKIKPTDLKQGILEMTESLAKYGLITL